MTVGWATERTSNT